MGNHQFFMAPQPNITKLDIGAGHTIVNLQAYLNQIIDQSIKSGAMTDGQTLRLVTQDGTNNDIVVMKGKDGILSGMAATLGVLTIDIASGNFQASGKTQSFAGTTTLGIGARHATLPRIDLIKTTTAATPVMSVVAGSASANPQPPAIPSGDAPLHLVWIDPLTVAVPQDFMIGSFLVDDAFPTNGAAQLANGLKKEMLPTVPKMADFTPAAPNWDADILFVDATAGVVTMDLPDPTAYTGYEREWRIVALGATANTITLDATASGAFTVNGAANDTITTDYQQYILIARGGAFYGY